MRYALALLALLALLPLAAEAQQRPVDPALQAAVGSMQLLIREYESQGQALDAARKRVAELEQLCGEVCKPKAEAK